MNQQNSPQHGPSQTLNPTANYLAFDRSAKRKTDSKVAGVLDCYCPKPSNTLRITWTGMCGLLLHLGPASFISCLSDYKWSPCCHSCPATSSSPLNSQRDALKSESVCATFSSTPLGWRGEGPSRSFMMGPHVIYLTSFSLSFPLLIVLQLHRLLGHPLAFHASSYPRISVVVLLTALHSFTEWPPSPPWRLGSQALIILLNAITCPFLPGNLTAYYLGWCFLLFSKIES